MPVAQVQLWESCPVCHTLALACHAALGNVIQPLCSLACKGCEHELMLQGRKRFN